MALVKHSDFTGL